MTRYIYVIIFILINLFANCYYVYPLEVETHEAINEQIVLQSISGFSLDGYLKNSVGLSDGINEYFDNVKAFDWISRGGRYEDKPPEWYSIPYLRSLNHFHDPLTNRGYGTGNSAVLWAQMDKGTQFPGGYYSWFDA